MKINSKKYTIIALIVLLGLLYTLARAWNREDTLTYKGIIIHTHKNGFISLLVDGHFDHSDEISPTVTEFTLDDNAKISASKKGVGSPELKRGMYVEVKSRPEILTSYPAQGIALQVNIMDEDTPLYMEAEVLDVLARTQDTVSTLHLKGFLKGYGENTEILVTIPKGSYYPFGLESSQDIIRTGDVVFVVLADGIKESDPLQGTSSSVIVVNPKNQ